MLDGFGEDVDQAGDDGQDIVEVVGDAAGEVPDGLHLLHLAQLLFGFELFAGGLDFAGAHEDFRFHLLGALAQPVGQLVLLGTALLQLNEAGDVFDPMDDVAELPVRPQHRRIARAPVAFLEAAALRLGLADIVFLHRHGVGAAELDHALERGAQVPHAVGGRIVRIVGKHLEQPAPEDRGALGLGGAQIGVAHCHDAEVGLRQHQIKAGRRLE
ncbi:hypothetical protein AB7M46_007195 [Bradyrhizobium elkanii]